MRNWPDIRIQSLLGIGHPILQAPMAGVDSLPLAAGVSRAGGLGALACALMNAAQIRQSVNDLKKQKVKALNLNFFCHPAPIADATKSAAWMNRLGRYYAEFNLDPAAADATPVRAAFDESYCALLEDLRPKVVSFHFGLPEASLVKRLKAAGILIFSSATTVAEAIWLEERGCDAIIAQGSEAGGHRGMFLTSDILRQVGTFALLPQIVDTVQVPVIAAGGIADGRGIAAAFTLGASAVQLGTAYLLCPEARVSPLYKEALKKCRDDQTVLTNVFSGRPARGIINRFIKEVGPINPDAPAFPLAGAAVGPLRKQSEADGSTDFMQLWAGQAAHLACELPAADLTAKLAQDALEIMASI